VQPLFPPWTNQLARGSLLASVLGATGLIVVLCAWVRSPAVTREGEPINQPVMFDHRHHVRDDGIDCLYCHTYAERSAFAGIPSTDVCIGCHGQIWPDSPLLEPVRKSAFEGTPIVWTQVNVLPDFVYFNHSIHIHGGVGCETCHGRVDEMAQVYQASPMSMGWCLDCHRDPDPWIRPADEITAMGVPPDRARGAALAADLHPPTDCSGCHR
jgi:hypothetical protein